MSVDLMTPAMAAVATVVGILAFAYAVLLCTSIGTTVIKMSCCVLVMALCATVALDKGLGDLALYASAFVMQALGISVPPQVLEWHAFAANLIDSAREKIVPTPPPPPPPPSFWSFIGQ